MVRALGALVRGFALGALLGASARLLMRVIAVGMGAEPELHVAVTLVLVCLFALSAAGAAVAAAMALDGWRRGIVLVVSSAPLALLGVAFAVGEVTDLVRSDVSMPGTVGLLVAAALILLLVVATPTGGWSTGLGRRSGSRSGDNTPIA